MDKKTIDILTGEIKAHFKPGPGRTKFRYVKGEDVISRLNQAFNHEWSSRVEDVREAGNQVIVLVALEAQGVVHQGFGGAEIATYRDGPKQGQPVDMSNSYKAAFTNAVKKAAEQFGVGLMSEDDYTPDVESPPIPVHTAPPAPAAAPAGPVTGSAVISTSKAETPSQETNQPNIMELLNNVDINALQEQVQNLLNTSTQTKPEPAPATAASGSLAKSYVESQGHSGYDPVASRSPEVPNPFVPSSPGEETINDIQLNALGGLAKMKKVTPEKAIMLGLPDSTKTKYEELTRNEAKTVIMALNSLDG